MPNQEGELNLELSIIETLEKADIKDELFELADAGIAHLASMEGILSELPWVRGLYSLSKVGMALRDRSLIKKLLHFLRESNKVTDEERMQMFWDIHDDHRKKNRNRGTYYCTVRQCRKYY